ncbi:hypothetical protein CVT26_014318, partial [Gymnopilus dilepis]
MSQSSPFIRDPDGDIGLAMLRPLEDLDFNFPPPQILPAAFKRFWDKPMVDLGPIDKVIPDKRFWGVRVRIYLRKPWEMPPIQFGTTITYGQEFCNSTGDIRYMAVENLLVEDGISFVVFNAYNKHQVPFPVDHPTFHPIIVIALQPRVHFNRNPTFTARSRVQHEIPLALLANEPVQVVNTGLLVLQEERERNSDAKA